MKLDLTEISTIYLTYDEPKKEEFWAHIKKLIPWAVRVDGVKGSDAAHKAAANASETDWFVLIDGDNIPDRAFYNNILDVTGRPPSAFRWKAKNFINGLTYGNGGLSVWHKDFVMNMKTHENSSGNPESNVEFCFEPNYHAMHNVYSITYPNQSPFQAWRAGFREGVKLCLDRGRRVDRNQIDKLYKPNLSNVQIWHNIGSDVENGVWACLGSRQATYKLFFELDWDFEQVQDFDKLNELWHSQNIEHCDPVEACKGYEKFINQLKGFKCHLFDSASSAFFKQRMAETRKNLSFMSLETA